MHIVFIAAGLYHHISEITDALYETYGENFHFFATDASVPKSIRIMGHVEGMCSRPYYRSIHDSEKVSQDARYWCTHADVGVIGCGDCEEFLHLRMESGKLTFKLKERIFKKGLTPQGRTAFADEIQRIYSRYRNAPLYYLCIGHFAAHDLLSVGVPREKLLKWGYFVYPSKAVPGNEPKKIGPLKLCWAGRFIPEKQPEYALRILRGLLDHHIDATLCYIGFGKQEAALRAMVEQGQLSHCVSFLGSMPEWQVREAMRRCDWLVFSSTGWEGWGVVLSEGMSEGLTCLATKAAGSSMELIQDKVNGFLIDDDIEKTNRICLELAQKGRGEWQRIGMNAKKTLDEKWSGKYAASRLIALLEHYRQNGTITPFSEGLCSPAAIEPYEEYEDTVSVEK